MRLPYLLVGMLLTAGLAIPGAPAAKLDFENNVLYAMRGDGEYIMSANDQAGTGGCWGGGAAGGSVPPLLGRSWDFRIVDSWSAPLQLDPAGTVDVYAFVGGATGEVGIADYTFELTLDGAVVASDTDTGVTYTGCSTALSWSVTPTITEVPVGGTLAFSISTENHVSGGARMNLMHNGADSSRVVLPIKALEGLEILPPTWTEVKTTDLSVSYESENPVSTVRTINWTAGPASAEMTYAATVLTGALNLAMQDGNGSTILEVELSADAGHNETIDAAPGNWTIQVTMDQFTGTFDLLLDGPDGDSNAGGARDGGSGGGDDGGGTVQDDDGMIDEDLGSEAANNAEQGDEGKKSPGIGPVLTLALLGAVLALRRR